jgi:heme-degrading monooxygenase HmoA
MSLIASTPKPPYYAVIFTSLRTEGDNGYGEMAKRMDELAAQQPGYLGIESVRAGLGLHAIQSWKANLEHQAAQKSGRELWYSAFRIRIAKVERDYGA